MARNKKRKFKQKEINIASIEISTRKYMRGHPIYRNEFKSDENINKLFLPKKRIFRERYLSR